MTRNASPDAKTELDPIEEAMARAKLRHQRGKAVYRPKPPIGLAARKILRQHAKKGGGSSLTKLQMDWQDIMGEKLAKICFPVKLSGTKVGRTLTLRVVPAAAAVVQHQEEMIRQRLSVAAGGNITKLKLEQGALPGRSKPKPPPRRVISASEEKDLQASVTSIESPALKAAIVALGRAVLADTEK